MEPAIETVVRGDRTGGPREPVNGWIHTVGAVLAVAALVLLTVQVSSTGSIRHLVGAATFGLTAFFMFSASALYHMRSRSPRQRLYQRLDHAMIYLFIAGTYTPVCLVALWHSMTARILLAVVWVLAIAGVVADVRGRPLRRGPATALYLGLGWAAVPLAPALSINPGLGGWLLVGGVFYTVGALFYWLQRPRRRIGIIGFHELWHLCVLAASASHFWAIRTYALAM